MPITGDDVDDEERLAAHAEPTKEAWKQTLADMRALAADREDEGWEVVTVGAAHTEPVSRDGGETDRYGLVYVVPDNYAEAVTDALEQGAFPRYEVYRASTGTRTFLVTELLDPDAGTAVLLAGNFERHRARGLVATTHRTGRLFTHLQTLDGTHLGAFEHEDPAKFFAEEDVRSHRPDAEG